MTRHIQKIMYSGRSSLYKNSICNQVDIIADTPLEFNSKIFDDIKKSVPILKNTGVTRSILLNTDNDVDLSSITFSITGYQNNVLIQEEVTGPPAQSLPVESHQFYDEIISIIPNITSSEKLNVTLGDTFCIFIGLDTAADNFSTYGLSLNTYANTSLSGISLYSTLDDINSNGVSFKDLTDSTKGYLTLLDEQSSSSNNYSIVPEKINITQSILIKGVIVPPFNLDTDKVIFNFIRV